MNHWNLFLYPQSTIFSTYSFSKEIQQYLFQQTICLYEKEDDEYEIPTESYIALGELMEPK